MKLLLNYFSKGELALWAVSVCLTVAAFCLFDRENYMTLAASLVGVTSLIFNAKGNPIGQVLMIIFSVLYGIISFGQQYYGEMITYLGMTMPMAAVALVTWFCHPFRGNRAEVTVSRIGFREFLFMLALTAVVTAIFRFILKYFNTAELPLSTLSVATSFAAAYLTFRRSPYFALAYAMNDVVLIALWIIAGTADPRCVSVIVCFMAFLANDIYGFVSWRRMEKRQSAR